MLNQRLLPILLVATALPITLALPVAARAADVFALPDAQLAAEARADLQLVRHHADAMAAILRRIEARRDLLAAPVDAVLAPADKALWKSCWGAFFDYAVAIEGVRQRWWGFVRQNPLSGRHAWGYLCTHHALAAQLAHGARLAQLATGRKALEALLDEPDPAYGVPEGSFRRFKLQVVHVATATQLYTGDAYLTLVGPLLRRHGVAGSDAGKRALGVMGKWSAAAKDVLLAGGAEVFVANAADLAKDWTLQAVMPVQKGIAEWMGDTRVARQGKPLVQAADIAALLPELRPGDVIVTRQNWFLSNLGLPGFWPHAELYLGTPDELTATFDTDPDVSRWVQALPAKKSTLSQHLRAVHPRPWQVYVQGRDFSGHGPIRVIESISEGVSLTATEHALGVDYIGVLRPQVPNAVKARAIVRAFGYQGRPYDFDFDFQSDASLVCTELVWKSYAPETQDGPGLRIPLEEVLGRATLPANAIVRRYDEEFGKPDAQLGFVAFLDGRESERRAVRAGPEALRASWSRAKWDVVQP